MRFNLWHGVVLAVMTMGTGWAQQPAVAVPAGAKTMPLWTQGAPGAKGIEEIDTPTLTVLLPKVANVTKTAVIVAPGGGYSHLSMEKEGFAIAQWLNDRGITAFVLKYRLGPKYQTPIELGDAQRAIRTVRASAAEYGIAADHIGMWGFSAGGHLAAWAGTSFDNGNAASTDPIDRQPSKPDFLILAYPVITMEQALAHPGSRVSLLGENPSPELVAETSVEQHVTKDTPPTFIFATTEDHTVPVINSVMFYEALVKAGVPAEMHLFQHGAHGAGLAAANPQLSPWTGLLIKWMRERGYAGPEISPEAVKRLMEGPIDDE